MLRPIYEVYEKEMEYDRGGRYREPWWSQTAPRAQLRDTIEKILAAARAHRQGSIIFSESWSQEEKVSTLGSEG